MDKTIKFSIDKVKVLEEISDAQLMLLDVYVCHDGNNAHNMPISLDTIKRASKTLLGKPLLYAFKNNDFLEHEKVQYPAGYFLENNDLRYIEENDKTYLVAKAVIWKIYVPDVYDVFERDQEKEVSMEIQLVETKENDDGQEEIIDMVFMGVTMLGSKYHAACDGSRATVIKFSEMVAETEKILQNINFSNNKVDNVNIEELIDKTISKYSSSIKKILLNKEVIDKNKNFSNDLITNNKNKEGDILEFNKEEFAKQQFSVTAMQVKEMMQGMCNSKKYTRNGYEYEKYWVNDFDNQYVYAYDYELSCYCAIPYSVEDGQIKMDFDNYKKAITVTQWIISDDEDETAQFVSKVIKEREEKFAQEIEKIRVEKEEFANKIKDLEKEKEEFSTKISTLETEKLEFEAKFSTLETENNNLKTENEQLKTFKSNIEKQEKQNKIEFAIQSVSEDLTQEQIDEWRNKVAEFSNIDEFSNAIKAFAFSIVKQKQNPEKQEFNRIHIPPVTTNENKSGSIWSNL